MIEKTLLDKLVARHPFPLVFATVSGAHLYGFPSPDSDVDLRGVHLLPIEQVVGLRHGEQTVEEEAIIDGVELDLVTHDAEKFFRLMLRRNGYVLEQITSPIVAHTTPEHAELRELATECVTRFHAHHYLGFAATQWRLFRKEDAPRVKPLLYLIRVLLTGIHLMRSGQVEANLVTLNQDARLSYVDELIARKLSGPEKCVLPDADLPFFEREYARLVKELEDAFETSKLPEETTAAEPLNDLLLRLRLGDRQQRPIAG